jgi:hypothetical protein
MSKGFIPPHGGYKNLLSYQKAEIVYDATVYFCGRFTQCNRARRFRACYDVAMSVGVDAWGRQTE